MFEKEAEEYFETECLHSYADTEEQLKEDVVPAFQKGAAFGYNKAKEEMQEQEYSMSYENGIFKCKYKSGKRFESVDGKTWKEIVLPKEIKENEMS